MMPEKRVRQRGGKTKTEKQGAIQRGPLDVKIDIEWTIFLQQLSDLVQTEVTNLIVPSFQWHWLKPASGAWLPLTNERGLASMVKQVITKPEPYIIVRMQPPRNDNMSTLVSRSFIIEYIPLTFVFSPGLAKGLFHKLKTSTTRMEMDL
jgi:hypothetical protein